MKVRKFKAKSMSEAMEQVKLELGAGAVILQNRSIKTPGFLGFFKQQYVEVIAALDNHPVKPVKGKVEELQVNNGNRWERNEQVLNEIRHLQQLITTKSFQSEEDFPPAYEYAFQYLQKQGIDQQLAREWIVDITKQAKIEVTPTKNEVKTQLGQKLEQFLQNKISLETDPVKQVMQFVGPTGVGKTTTIAKIASQMILKENKSIAFITLDTYRIAAIEQLKTYAKILNCPLEVAYSLDDYKLALQKLSSYDHILVDTAGRNFSEVQYVKQLKDLLAVEQVDVETILVLALTTKDKDLELINEQFQSLFVRRLILTKIDETSTYGSMINLLWKESIPIEYITNGQNVPDDLLKPNVLSICQMIMSSYGDE